MASEVNIIVLFDDLSRYRFNIIIIQMYLVNLMVLNLKYVNKSKSVLYLHIYLIKVLIWLSKKHNYLRIFHNSAKYTCILN